MELQLTEGTKKIKRTEYEFKNTKACFPILTLPFQETYFTQSSKRKWAKPHHTRPHLCEAHLDKIKSTQNKRHVSFRFLAQSKKKKKKKKDRLRWDSVGQLLQIIQTIFYIKKKNKKKKKQFWNESTCSWWVNILYILNSLVIKCFSNSFTSGSWLNKSCYPQDTL